MAKEILAIPEEKLKEVIYVIRTGLHSNMVVGNFSKVSNETRQMLSKWCKETEEYLNELG